MSSGVIPLVLKSFFYSTTGVHKHGGVALQAGAIGTLYLFKRPPLRLYNKIVSFLV
jgi:hypothetical protein